MRHLGGENMLASGCMSRGPRGGCPLLPCGGQEGHSEILGGAQCCLTWFLSLSVLNDDEGKKAR